MREVSATRRVRHAGYHDALDSQCGWAQTEVGRHCSARRDRYSGLPCISKAEISGNNDIVAAARYHQAIPTILAGKGSVTRALGENLHADQRLVVFLTGN